MKKSIGILGAVVVIGVAYAGASWYVGKQAQTTLERVVAQANQRFVSVLGPNLAGSGLKLAISDYKRHVFSSDVIYTLQLTDSSGQPGEYIFSDHLQHGPFPAAALKNGDFSPQLAFSRAQLIPSAVTQKWFDSLNGETPIVATTHVGFSGSGRSEWEFKPLAIAEDGDSVTFSGGVVDVTFSKDFKDSTVAGQFESIAYVSARNGEDMQIKGIKLNSKTTTSADANVQLQSSASADSMVVMSADADPLQAEQIAANLNSLQKGNLLEGSLRYDFGRLKVGQSELGSLSVGAKGADFDVNALTALAQEYDRINAARPQSDENIELTDEEAALLREKLLAVLATDPIFSIDPFIWKNDQGESSLALTVNLSGEAAKAAGSGTQFDLLLPQIIKLLTLDVSISKPMFVKAFSQLQGGGAVDPQTATVAAFVFDQYAGRLGRAGLVNMEDDKASTAIKYESNSVVVNGKAMSMVEFMQRAISVMM
ncbi:MAG TPA: YdgA family protein [Eoetvoesiella sp.]